jgi:hypothetical protein
LPCSCRGSGLPTYGNPLAGILILIFGFFFATVSSRSPA